MSRSPSASARWWILGKVTRLDQRSHRAGNDSGRSHCAWLCFVSPDARVERRRGLHDHAAAGSPARDGRHAEGDHAPLLAHRPSGRRRQAGPLSWQDHDHARAWRADARAGGIPRLSRHARSDRRSRRARMRHEINIPWDGAIPAPRHWNHTMAERSLRKLRDYGFTSFSGMPMHPLSRLQGRQAAI